MLGRRSPASQRPWRRSLFLAPVVLILVAVSCGGAATRGAQASHPKAGTAHEVTCRLRGAHTERVNVSSSGRQANNSTSRGPMSASGRFVAFSSVATNLVPADRNGVEDVFLRDRLLGRTIRVSVSTPGGEANGASYFPLISSNGRLVFFRSRATNLVRRDRDTTEDLFVHDRRTGVTRRLPLGWIHGKRNHLAAATGHPGCNRWCANAVDADGSALALTSKAAHQLRSNWHGGRDVFVRLRHHTIGVTAGRRAIANGPSEASAISEDGTVVAFRSFASDLVRDDTNRLPDVFVRDLVTGSTERVNVSSEGMEANATSFRGMMSGDGRFVGFRSQASNLVPDDTNGSIDVFVHDRLADRTIRVSVSTEGAQARGDSLSWMDRQTSFMSRPFLTRHGRYAAFTSRAANLVLGDTNGMRDVFVHDLATGTTVRVSTASNGGQSDGESRVAGISAHGHVVAFMSFASNLVRGDTNGRRDYFVRVRAPELHCAFAETRAPRPRNAK